MCVLKANDTNVFKQNKREITMKSLQNISKLTLLGLSLLVSFAACSAVNNDVETLSDEDIELATQIIGESVSDDNSGIMSSMYDAVSTVGKDGILTEITEIKLTVMIIVDEAEKAAILIPTILIPECTLYSTTEV